MIEILNCALLKTGVVWPFLVSAARCNELPLT